MNFHFFTVVKHILSITRKHYYYLKKINETESHSIKISADF